MTDLTHSDRLITEALEEAWSIFWKDPVVYIIASLLALAVVTVSLGLLSGVMSIGLIRLTRRLRAGEDVGVLTIFSGFDHALPAILATLVMAVGISVGLFLLVLPGLFLACAWSLTFTAMEAENLSAGAALSKSYEVFKESPFVVAVVVLLLGLLNAIAGSLVIVTLLTAPFSAIVLLVLFERLLGLVTNADARPRAPARS